MATNAYYNLGYKDGYDQAIKDALNEAEKIYLQPDVKRGSPQGKKILLLAGAISCLRKSMTIPPTPPRQPGESFRG